ncbi:hypothetical protein Patl1_10281 [Pistacia atlantica]|uniref:Uncharacterized protein n=1 Tax=Pistacia atlantica TaxID=434234 RepID=A0ACC1A578_9ROSI|nr:hypothetical protein Patl1_10281 [Pistacia atlantica]
MYIIRACYWHQSSFRRQWPYNNNLALVNEVEGLQIKKNGMWVPVKPLPGAFIVNNGNILEVMLVTKDSHDLKVKSYVHRDGKTFGFDLLVVTNDIYELVKEPLTTIPPRYVRPHQDPPFVSNATSLPQVPVIDLKKLLSGDLTDSELDKLHRACKEWADKSWSEHFTGGESEDRDLGVFQSANGGEEEVWKKAGDVEGFGQAFVMSEEQKLDWADMFFLTSLPFHLRKPHLIPKLPLPFRETLEAYSLELKDLAIIILNQMGKALRIEDDYMKQLFEEARQRIRLNYYPPCPQPELAVGINAHSDCGGLTILFQLNEMDGLQIRKNEMWVPVKPLPGAFIINIGNVLEDLTFYSPNANRDMGPTPSLITPENPALFRISVADYYKGFFSHELQGKSYLDVLRIKDEDESG